MFCIQIYSLLCFHSCLSNSSKCLFTIFILVSHNTKFLTPYYVCFKRYVYNKIFHSLSKRNQILCKLCLTENRRLLFVTVFFSLSIKSKNARTTHSTRTNFRNGSFIRETALSPFSMSHIYYE